MKKFAFAAVLALFGAASASAATLNFDPRPGTPGGSQQIYQLTGGDYLGLWGFTSASVGTYNTSDLVDEFGIGKNNIVSFHYSDPGVLGAWGGGVSEFDEFGTTFEIATLSRSDGRLFDSFWVRWTGGNLQNVNNNSTMGASATLAGDPLAPIPLPAGFPLLLAALGGLAFLRRKRAV